MFNRGILMSEEQNLSFCPECGEKLKQGEMNRINSGIDIACHVCGTEISGNEISVSPQKVPKSKNESNDLGDKIKKGIQSFVKGIKNFAESFDGDKKKDEDTSNDYSSE